MEFPNLPSSTSRTFQTDELNPLLDLGLLHQVGGFHGEDELPKSRSEAVPVVLDHRDTVLWAEEEEEEEMYVHKSF